tara:strand:+ start:14883 stop:15935 length:1053 start_codon:yes stop_codon:yes gene_type:complete
VSKIELEQFVKVQGQARKDYSTDVAINNDVDEDDKPFQRLSMWVTDPVSKEDIRFEWNKTDSALALTKEDNKCFIDSDDVIYYQKNWEVETYKNFLNDATLVPPNPELDDYNIRNNMAVPKNPNTYDEVYVNKQLVRTDYNIGLWQAQPMIDEVEKVFGKDRDWKQNRFNIIGTYTAHEDAPLRPPYTNEKTYSWYNVFIEMPDETLAEYNVPKVGYTYNGWHAIKYNVVSGKKQLKVVIQDDEFTSNYQKHPDTFIPRPPVPYYANKSHFFAKIFNEDGTEADEYDVFFVTTLDIMKEFCAEHGHPFPIPEERENDFIWIYGIVYDKNTLEVKQVKGYVRYPTDGNEWL